MGTDRNIRAAVHEQLVTDPLIDAGDIVVEVADGAVSLTGTVPSLAQFTEAAATARRVAAVTTVDNLLAVALPSQGRRDDAALTQLANQALAANPAVPDSVTATAREGTVFPTVRQASALSASPPKTLWPAWPGCSATAAWAARPGTRRRRRTR